ncbi:hypothetical protein [Crassaminicella profunda]|nr:hypothetical protein [Crassaminicella profunda]
MKLDIVINNNNVIGRKNLDIIKKDYLSKIKESQMLGEYED